MTPLRTVLSRTITASVLTWAFVAGAGAVLAENLESDSFIIQFGNFNVTSGEKSGDSFIVTDTVGQTVAGPYGAYGSSSFFVGAGFQYIYQLQRFSFSISKLQIDFGTLAPNDHVEDSHTMRITTNGASGYAVYAYEAHPLRHLSDPSVEIPDTNCDSSCDIANAGIWTDETKPGFGYNMTGDHVPSTFLDPTYFRPFANLEANDAMQVVMSSPNVTDPGGNEATITYKVGVAGSQAAGNYATNVVYVAVPGY